MTLDITRIIETVIALAALRHLRRPAEERPEILCHDHRDALRLAAARDAVQTAAALHPYFVETIADGDLIRFVIHPRWESRLDIDSRRVLLLRLEDLIARRVISDAFGESESPAEAGVTAVTALFDSPTGLALSPCGA